MPPRPAQNRSSSSSNRLSAVYIGPSPIPDLPEPPSPTNSGLPSPPATNSTGSGNGSTGDPVLLNAGPNAANDADVDDDDIHEEDGDDTARFNQNILSLQRLRSLTQRNRIVLDKLSSYPRTASPSPSPRSPPLGSGSETEREHESSLHTRHPSVPSSPLKSLSRTASTSSSTPSPSVVSASASSSNTSNSPRRRKHVSLAMSHLDREQLWDQDKEPLRPKTSLSFVTPNNNHDTPASSSTRPGSNGGSAKRRAALPLEFRRGVSTEAHQDPMTPYRPHSRRPTGKWASEDLSNSDLSIASSSSSGVNSERERRSAVPSSGSERIRRRASPTMMGMREYRERRQSIRGGSAESALGDGGTRSLVGEEFRAAGLSPTRRRFAARSGSVGRSLDLDKGDGGDVFVGRTRREAGMKVGDVTSTPRAATSMADYRYLGRGDNDDDDDDDEERRRLNTRRSAFPLGERLTRRETSLAREVASRETSLAREREREMDRDRERDRSMSSMSRYDATRHASPFGSRRYTPVIAAPPSASTSTSAAGVVPHAHQEHTRLMMESLGMFEGHLARLGPFLNGSAGGTGTGASTPATGGGGDLLRSAQIVVGAADRLNAMMRYGTTRAMEQQVDAEVEGGGERRGRDMVDMWREVGGEFREAQRVSDDLVRGLTGFLLGIGKVVREFAGGGGAEGQGQGQGQGQAQNQHLRSVSLDEEGLSLAGRRARGSLSPDVVSARGSTGVGSGSGSGRRSVESRRSGESRRSWEPRDDLSRRMVGRSDGAPVTTLSQGSRFEGRYETPPSAAATLRNGIGTRRLFTPREQQAAVGNSGGRIVASDSQGTVHAGYEPSPTPASRNQGQNHETTLGRSRTLPSLGLPRPLPTLPSESLLRRNQTVIDKPTPAPPPQPPPSSSSRDRDRERRQASVTSIATVRGNTSHPHFPAMLTTPSNATTAVTAHTVSTLHTTPDHRSSGTSASSSTGTGTSTSNSAFSTQRDYYLDHDHDQLRSGVAFSRPSTVSVSALNGLQQQDLEHEQRRRTVSSGSAGVEPSTSVRSDLRQVQVQVQQQQVRAVLSGSETERDVRRRTVAGRSGRVSLDGNRGSRTGTGTGTLQADVAVVGLGGGKLSMVNGTRRERRRTVTDVWPRE